MKNRVVLSLALLGLGWTVAARASQVQLSIMDPAQMAFTSSGQSSALFYDIVGSQGEWDYCASLVSGNRHNSVIFGHHAWHASTSYGHNYYHNDTTGLPTSGLITTTDWSYQIGAGATIPTGYNRYGAASWTDPEDKPSRQAQSATLWVSVGGGTVGNVATAQMTYTLPEIEREKYSEFNMLLMGENFIADAAATTTTTISVKYVGDAGYTTLVSFGSSGGKDYFGNARMFTQLGNVNSTGAFALADTSTQYLYYTGVSGSRVNAVVTNPAYLWEFTDPLELDGNKDLESVRIYMYGQRGTASARVQFGVNVFGMTATPIPEPASVGLLGLGAVAMILRRRLRS